MIEKRWKTVGSFLRRLRQQEFLRDDRNTLVSIVESHSSLTKELVTQMEHGESDPTELLNSWWDRDETFQYTLEQHLAIPMKYPTTYHVVDTSSDKMYKCIVSDREECDRVLDMHYGFRVLKVENSFILYK